MPGGRNCSRGSLTSEKQGCQREGKKGQKQCRASSPGVAYSSCSWGRGEGQHTYGTPPLPAPPLVTSQDSGRGRPGQ